MTTRAHVLLVLAFLCVVSGCDDSGDVAQSQKSSRDSVEVAMVKQISPSFSLRDPGENTSPVITGGSYKVLSANASGVRPQLNDTVLMHYTAWVQRTGATFFSTRAENEPISVHLGHVSPAFASVLPLLHKGERAAIWVPRSAEVREPVVYEVEVVGVTAPDGNERR